MSDNLHEVVMPQLGMAMTEGEITEWLKSVGDTVTEDEPLFTIATEKIETEVVAPASGVLKEIVAPVGAVVPVRTPVAVIDTGNGA